MPNVLSAFRRISHSKKSKNSSSSSSSDSRHANRSSTTLGDAASETTTTPPSTLGDPQDAGILNGSSDQAPTPRRPLLNGNGTNRYSVMSNGTFSAMGSRVPSGTIPLSPLAPRITSITEGSFCQQKVILIRGQIGDPDQIGDLHRVSTSVHKSYDGEVCIYSQDGFPTYTVPVIDSRFKAVIHLQAGKNVIRFDFIRARTSHGNIAAPEGHTNHLTLNYLPLMASPPLHLAILVAKDSPELFDAPPARAAGEGNGLDMAKRKYRMAAYLWQAFTAEQMQRHGLYSRCFRLEEEWQPSTLGNENPAPWRSEARIHVIRVDKTVAELNNPDYAQQNPTAKNSGALFEIAANACKEYFKTAPGQKQYVSAMYLDTHWDPELKLLTAHAALGGGDDQLGLAIFGSHALHSYPSCIQHIIPAFTDCTRTDTNFVANDCNESGSSWEAANIGIGAHLHEVGHLFGLPHRSHGVMLRDYVKLNRTFTVGEPYSTRTRSPGKRFCPREEECVWSRIDCLRFRFHPCFRHNLDRPAGGESGIQVWSVENEITASSESGIGWIELYADDDEFCYAWKEFLPRTPVPGQESPRSDSLPRTVRLNGDELKERLKQNLPANKRSFKKLRIQINSGGNQQYTVEDFSKLTDKSARTKLPNGQTGYRSGMLGLGSMPGSKAQELIIHSTYLTIKEKDILGNISMKKKILRSIKVFHGRAIDGLEFCYDDSSTQMFGKRGGKPGGDEFFFDTSRGETLAGFYLRAGAWIDGIQFITTMTGRKSPIYGNATGGSGHTLMPPTGYLVAGISGSCGDWLDSFQLIVTR